MRLAPLIVWTMDLDLIDVKRAIVADTEFTHPDKMVQLANVVYAVAVQYVLKNSDEENIG